ncbi:MAG TPA: efflux RND transporter periplasmic adaptor subunit, partial [Kofleriaceae bacterium]|nr:efflux RND transporter periplasmic adaptor subunit [Kofleriaceae bacterium]
IDVARAALAQAEAALDDTRVTAPFAGRIRERRVEPGALASPATPLLVLDDGGSPRVEAAVDEQRASAIHLGDEVSVELADGTRPPGARIGEIVPSVDVASRAFLVKIDLPATVGALAPGTFARVGFAQGTRARLVVPTAALSARGALDRVCVVEGGTAHLRMVGRGETVGAWTEILSGLTSGERVVVAPAGVRDGARVEVRR